MRDLLHKRQELEHSQYPTTQTKQNSERMREVLTIIGGPHVTGDNPSACHRYAKEAKKLPQTHVHMVDERPPEHSTRA